ncbi:MAG: copper-binding protein [Betaproteobacteria bacterium]|nr:copper-binding protein [Betaproteobacteria bacterium]
MKSPITLAIMALGLSSPLALAASDHAGHGAGGSHMMAQADVALSEGTIKKVDKAAGKVTIAHGPLGNLGMPSMTMVFRVKNAAWLEQMKVGDKIRFLADRVDGAFTVVRYEPAD